MRPIPLILSVLVLAFVQVTFAISKASANKALKLHNELRAKHGSPPLHWNKGLEKFAQKWSNACVFQHSSDHYENLGMGYPNITSVVNAWYSESEKYDYNSPGFKPEIGHFSAMIWKDTTQIGCGIKKCKGGAPLYTCAYHPPGNYPDAESYRKNVFPPK